MIPDPQNPIAQLPIVPIKVLKRIASARTSITASAHALAYFKPSGANARACLSAHTPTAKEQSVGSARCWPMALPRKGAIF